MLRKLVPLLLAAAQEADLRKVHALRASVKAALIGCLFEDRAIRILCQIASIPMGSLAFEGVSSVAS